MTTLPVAMVTNGVVSLPLHMIVLPVMSPIAVFQPYTAQGKLKAVIIPIDPIGFHCSIIMCPGLSKINGWSERQALTAERGAEPQFHEKLLVVDLRKNKIPRLAFEKACGYSVRFQINQFLSKSENHENHHFVTSGISRCLFLRS